MTRVSMASMMRCPVMGVDDRLANLERHVVGCPLMVAGVLGVQLLSKAEPCAATKCGHLV